MWMICSHIWIPLLIPLSQFCSTCSQGWKSLIRVFFQSPIPQQDQLHGKHWKYLSNKFINSSSEVDSTIFSGIRHCLRTSAKDLGMKVNLLSKPGPRGFIKSIYFVNSLQGTVCLSILQYWTIQGFLSILYTAYYECHWFQKNTGMLGSAIGKEIRASRMPLMRFFFFLLGIFCCHHILFLQWRGKSPASLFPSFVGLVPNTAGCGCSSAYPHLF